MKWIKINYVTQNDIKTLLSHGIIRNTSNGYVNKEGNSIGFYRTVGCSKKRYVQDEYADLAKTLIKKK